MRWPPRSTSSSRASSGRPLALFAAVALAAGASAVLASCPRSPQAPPRRTRSVTLLATAGLQGQLEPFSDPARTSGGLARLASVVRKQKAAAPATWWVDAGDALFGRSDLTEEWLAQSERRARAIAEAYTAAGNDVFAVGERDLLLGQDFVRAAGLRGLLNAGRGPDTAPSATLLEAGGVKVAFLAASGREPSRAIAEQAQQARGAGAELVVALVHATAESAQLLVERLPPGAVDLAIAGHAASELANEAGVLTGRAPVFAPPSRGRALLKLEVGLGRAGSAVVSVPSAEQRQVAVARAQAALAEAEAGLDGPLRDARVQALRQRIEEAQRTPTVPDDATVVAWQLLKVSPETPGDEAVGRVVARFATDVARLAAAAGPEKPCASARMGQPVYIGVEGRCAGCHPSASAHWKASAHARALDSLSTAGRARDLECARCHLTGLFAPGGTCSVEAPKGREGVQCEGCHGPASQHAEAPARGLLDVTEQTCRACHTSDHDPGFDYRRDRARVLGPGHGEPP
ncbi:MAG: multiheme c-type cytochrome [Myxococcales bacterium]